MRILHNKLFHERCNKQSTKRVCTCFVTHHIKMLNYKVNTSRSLGRYLRCLLCCGIKRKQSLGIFIFLRVVAIYVCTYYVLYFCSFSILVLYWSKRPKSFRKSQYFKYAKKCSIIKYKFTWWSQKTYIHIILFCRIFKWEKSDLHQIVLDGLEALRDMTCQEYDKWARWDLAGYKYFRLSQ